MTPIEIFILSLFDMIMMMLIVNALIDIEKNTIAKNLLYIVVGAVFIGVNSYFIQDKTISHMMSTLIIFSWVQIYCKDKGYTFIEVTTVFIILSILLFGIQLASILLLQLAVSNFQYIFPYGLIAQSISLIFIILIWKYVPIKIVYLYIEQKNKWVRTIMLNLYVIYYLLSILWFQKTENIVHSIIGLFVIIMITMFINIIFLREGLINKANEEKLAIYETYLPIIDTIMEEFRLKRHDYHNHLQTILTIKNKMTEIELNSYGEYINQLVEEEIWVKLSKLKHQVIAAFLYSKHKNAREKGIRLNLNISNYDLQTEYTDFELVEMYGILVDNAIEAAEKMDNKVVDMYLDQKEKCNIFKTVNSCDYMPADIQKIFHYRYTTKGEKGHGIGLHKLQSMIYKRNGTIDTYYDTKENKFHIEIQHM